MLVAQELAVDKGARRLGAEEVFDLPLQRLRQPQGGGDVGQVAAALDRVEGLPGQAGGLRELRLREPALDPGRADASLDPRPVVSRCVLARRPGSLALHVHSRICPVA